MHGKGLVIFLLVLIVATCGRLKGEFGFKTLQDDTYHKIGGVPEFSADKEVRWVYVFSSVSGKRDIGVVYLKKEVVWVEIMTSAASLDSANRIIYGTISGLEPGQYQIVLTEVKKDNREIDRKDFVIYTEEDDDEL